MRKQYRQGDVLIIETNKKGGAPLPKDNGKVVLAYGEVTGHSHAIVKGAVLLEAPKCTGILKVETEAPLKHEEHATIVLPKGSYEIIQQVEYQREFKRVVD